MSTPPLPAKIIEPSNIEQHTNNQLSKIFLPEIVNVLPITEVSKLSENIEILKGYLVTLISPDIDDYIKETDAISEQLSQYSQKFKKLEQKKMDALQRIKKLESLDKEWKETKNKMDDTLHRFQNSSLRTKLQESLQESQRLTDSIEFSFVSHHEQHDEQAIQEFIKTYKNERALYHLRKEKLRRFEESRVGGI